MGDSVTTIGAGGVAIPRSAEDAALLGSDVQDPSNLESVAQFGRRRKMFDTTADKLQTLAEGIVDGAALGLLPVRETGEAGDLRRDVNGTYDFVGQALGTVAGLATGVGPVRSVAQAGEALGAAAAKSFLRQGEKTIVNTALKEAGAGAALTGATAFGHQLMDTVIEDRAFSGEAVLHEMKLGGVFGLVGGGLMGGLGKLARSGTRAEVQAQGGLVGDLGDALGTHETARAAYGEALHFHEAQLGALKQLRKSGALGEVSDDFLRVREAAVKDARRAQAALREIDVEAALSGRDPAAYKNLQRRWSEYSRTLESVDDIMTPHPAELGSLGNVTKVRPVQGSEDFVVPAARVGEAIPKEAEEAYLAQYKSRSTDQVEPPGRFPQGTPSATPDAGTRAGGGAGGDLAALDEAIKKLPLRGADENAAAFGVGMGRMGESPAARVFKDATQIESVPLGAVAKQLDAAEAAAQTQVRRPSPDFSATPERIERPLPADVVDRMMDSWMELAEPRMRPWHQAQARAQAAMEGLYQKTGGRLDSARGLGILEADGIRPSADPVGSYMDSVYAVNRAGRFVADETRGVATPLRKAGNLAVKAAMGLAGAKLLGVTNMALLTNFLGYGGRLAASTGRLYRRVVDSVAGFMTSTKVRSVAVAAGNHPWAYSERGPIKDPVERIREIQFLAANPDAIRARVREQAGELYAAAPEHVRALEERAVGQLQALAIRAPAIYWDRLGRPLSPPQGKLRAFYEFENATNDLDSVLSAIRTGAVTNPQIEALQISWPAVYTRVAQGFLAEPERLQKFDRAKLRVVEQVTGLPLTGASDPMFLARQQQGWAPAAPPTPPGRPQAFNINPDGAPTPSQANAAGRAPGN
jgi:hypothetical protein